MIILNLMLDILGDYFYLILKIKTQKIVQKNEKKNNYPIISFEENEIFIYYKRIKKRIKKAVNCKFKFNKYYK